MCFGGPWVYTPFPGSSAPPQGFWVSLCHSSAYRPWGLDFSPPTLIVQCWQCWRPHLEQPQLVHLFFNRWLLWRSLTNNLHRNNLLALLQSLEVLCVASCSAIFRPVCLGLFLFFFFSPRAQAWFAYCFYSPLYLSIDLFILILAQRHQTLTAFFDVCNPCFPAPCSLKAA